MWLYTLLLLGFRDRALSLIFKVTELWSLFQDSLYALYSIGVSLWVFYLLLVPGRAHCIITIIIIIIINYYYAVFSQIYLWLPSWYLLFCHVLLILLCWEPFCLHLWNSSCQAESSQAKVYLQISLTADTWNDKRAYIWYPRLGAECSVNLGGRSMEE